jgi:predicted amidohydrolase
MRDDVRLLIVQSVLHEAMNGPSFHDAVRHNLYRSVALLEKSVRRNGRPNIVVLPEFFLTGLSSTRSHQECLEMARHIPGPETDVLGEVAREHEIYICGASWERDDDWPDRWFNTGFIVGPSGSVELKYRKINEGNYQLGLTDTTPGDIYSAYVERYGEEALWPVLETDYGNLSCVICFDLNFAETTQMMALRGAEIILNPTGEPYGQHRDGWELARRTRAFENAVYLASANHGGYVGTIRDGDRVAEDTGLMTGRVPRGVTSSSRSHGGSEVVDFNGRVIARIDGQGEAVIEATLDLRALRRARGQRSGSVPRLGAEPPKLRRLWALGYQRAAGFPLDELLDDPLHEQADGPRHLAAVSERLKGTPIRRASGESPAGQSSPTVLAYQAPITFVADRAGADEVIGAIGKALDRTARSVELERRRCGADVVVLPDGWPVSFLGTTEFRPAGLVLDGADGQRIGDFARAQGLHVVGACRERGSHGLSYRTAYVFDDRGELIYTRRALAGGPAAYEPPADLPDLEPDGDDPLSCLEIVDTRFGAWAAVVGREIASVQVLRLLTYRGAEVVFNPAADYDAELAAALYQVRRTRARENSVYVVAAGQGPIDGGPPRDASRAASLIVDYRGQEVVADEAGRDAAIAADLDLAGLRRARGRGAMNFLLQLRPQLYVQQLASAGRAAQDDVGMTAARPASFV